MIALSAQARTLSRRSACSARNSWTRSATLDLHSPQSIAPDRQSRVTDSNSASLRANFVLHRAQTEQISGVAPSRRCSSTVARPPVNALRIFRSISFGGSLRNSALLVGAPGRGHRPLPAEPGRHLAVDDRRLREAQRLRHVAGDPKVRVLVDPARDQAWHGVAGDPGGVEARDGLQRGIEDEADVRLGSEPEDRLDRRDR